MPIFTKLRIYIDAYLKEWAGVPLMELIEARLKTLFVSAPHGEPPAYLAVQPDGKTVTVELVRTEQAFNDEQVLRSDMGDTYANQNQQKAVKINEEILKHEHDIREQEANIVEIHQRKDDLLKSSPDHHFMKSRATKNMLAFAVVAIGEIGALFFLFSDYFGIDPAKLGQEISNRPLQVFATGFFTVGFFAGTLWLGELALHSKQKAQRVISVIGLVIIALIIGKMRMMQAVALQETSLETWFLGVFFTCISLLLPLVAANFAGKWKEASMITGPIDSMAKRLREQEQKYVKKLRIAEQKRKATVARLEQNVQEYVTHYQSAVNAKNKSRLEWEEFLRYVEGYLAELRLTYLFWKGRRARQLNVPRPVKRALQLAAILLFILALTLLGTRSAHAAEAFNMEVLGDRSSSANGYSCSNEAIVQAGNMWVKKADDAGGGTFEILLIDQGFDSTAVIFSESYPERFPRPVTAHKKKWRTEFLQKLKAIKLPSGKGSAIAEAICRSSLRIPNDGHTVVYIMSDMREIDEAFNFESQVPSEKEFTNWLEANAIKPRFNGSTKVAVRGMHPYTPANTGRMTAQNYDRLLKLWQAVFDKWGVKATISECNDFKDD